MSRGNNLFPVRNNGNHLSQKYLVKNKMQNGCDKRKRGKINRFKTRTVNCTPGLVEIILTHFCSIWYLNVSLPNYLQNVKKVISTHLKIVHTRRLQFNYSNYLKHWKLNCQHCLFLGVTGLVYKSITLSKGLTETSIITVVTN